MAARVDGLEGFTRQPQVDTVERADGGCFRIGEHGAKVAPHRRPVECFFFVLVIGDVNSLEGEPSLVWREHSYPIAIRREVDVERLAVIDPAAFEAGDEAGYLSGNAMFQDLRGLTWAEASAAVAAEAGLIARLMSADDLEAEADLIDEERYDAFDDAEALWNLDVGVIGAVAALSALGCASVASCNAGGFGGQHQAAHPYVAFALPRSAVSEALTLAEAASVGLVLDRDGLAQLYSDRDLGLARFAALAVEKMAP